MIFIKLNFYHFSFAKMKRDSIGFSEGMIWPGLFKIERYSWEWLFRRKKVADYGINFVEWFLNKICLPKSNFHTESVINFKIFFWTFPKACLRCSYSPSGSKIFDINHILVRIFPIKRNLTCYELKVWKLTRFNSCDFSQLLFKK